MTPERLLELADYIKSECAFSSDLAEVAYFLRDCAKCEPVYLIVNPMHDNVWNEVSLQQMLVNNLREVNCWPSRILYTAPQVAVVKVPDTLVDVSRESSYSIGWNACRAEVLRLNEVK